MDVAVWLWGCMLAVTMGLYEVEDDVGCILFRSIVMTL